MDNLEKLIQKYLENRASEEEISSLEAWVKKNRENKQFFEDIVSKWNLQCKYNTEDFNTKKAFENFKDAINQFDSKKSIQKSFIQKINPIFKYAAVFTLTVLLSSYYYFSQNEISTKINTERGIVLKFDDGTVKIIDENNIGLICNNKEQATCYQEYRLLSYNNIQFNFDDTKNHIYPFNEIIVPNGEVFNLILSDGSSVLLNSGSRIKYPQKFSKNQKTRTVKLEGEAYFEVVENSSLPFIVQTSDLNIKVLGTKFNVSAYSEDKHVKTALLEGSVCIFDPENIFEDITITPNQLAILDRARKQLDISNTNASDYIAWINNKLLFKDEPFKEIANKIERRYNVKIINHFDSLNSMRFCGEFDNESVDDIFKTFTTCINFSYTINNETIIINKLDNN